MSKYFNSAAAIMTTAVKGVVLGVFVWNSPHVGNLVVRDYYREKALDRLHKVHEMQYAADARKSLEPQNETLIKAYEQGVERSSKCDVAYDEFIQPTPDDFGARVAVQFLKFNLACPDPK